VNEVEKMHCFTKEKESCSILGYAPLCAEIEKVPSDRFIPPDGISACIPGAIAVDPYVRRLAESAGMDVTENAVWLLTIAIKEYTKYLLGNSINRQKEVDDGKVPSSPVTSLKLQNKKSHSDVRLSRQQLLPVTVQPSRCITSNDIHGLISFMPNSGGRSLSGCISRGTFERILFSTYESSVVRGEEAFQTVNRFVLSSLLDPLSKKVEEESPGSLASLPQSKELGDGDSNAQTPSPTFTRQSLPSLSTEIVQTSSDAPSQLKTIEPISALRVRDPSPSHPEISSGTIPMDEVPSPMNMKQSKDLNQTTLPITELSASVQSQPLDAPPFLPIAQPEVKARPVTVRGLGRGAKNLASLKARSSQTVLEGSTPDASAAADSIKEDTPSARACYETPSSQTQDKSLISDSEQVHPSTTDDDLEVSEKQLTQTIATRGRGKGFGVKNLAAMRARSFTLRSEDSSLADNDRLACDAEVENVGKESSEVKTESDTADCDPSTTNEVLNYTAVQAKVEGQSCTEVVSFCTFETSTTHATTEVTFSSEVGVQMAGDFSKIGDKKDDIVVKEGESCAKEEEDSHSKEDAVALTDVIERSTVTGELPKMTPEKNVEAEFSEIRTFPSEQAENAGYSKDAGDPRNKDLATINTSSSMETGILHDAKEIAVSGTMAQSSKELTLDGDKINVEAESNKEEIEEKGIVSLPTCEQVTANGEGENEKVESNAEVEQGCRPSQNGENAKEETAPSVGMAVEDEVVPAQGNESPSAPKEEADIATEDESAVNKAGFLTRVSEALLTYVGNGGNEKADISTKTTEQSTLSVEGVRSSEGSPLNEKQEERVVIAVEMKEEESETDLAIGAEHSNVAVDAEQTESKE
jgi:hypothetical protein